MVARICILQDTRILYWKSSLWSKVFGVWGYFLYLNIKINQKYIWYIPKLNLFHDNFISGRSGCSSKEKVFIFLRATFWNGQSIFGKVNHCFAGRWDRRRKFCRSLNAGFGRITFGLSSKFLADWVLVECNSKLDWPQ